MGIQQTESGSVFVPVECPKGHQIYVVYFPVLDAYGFACSVCHELGVTVSAKEGMNLEVRLVSGPKLKNLTGDLLLYTQVKAEKISCEKFHQLAVMVCGQPNEVGSYGLFDNHCKLYAKEFEHRGRVLRVALQYMGQPIHHA